MKENNLRENFYRDEWMKWKRKDCHTLFLNHFAYNIKTIDRIKYTNNNDVYEGLNNTGLQQTAKIIINDNKKQK